MERVKERMFLRKRETKENKKQFKGDRKWRVPPPIFPKLSPSCSFRSVPLSLLLTLNHVSVGHLSDPATPTNNFEACSHAISIRAWNRPLQKTCYVSTLLIPLKSHVTLTLFSSILASSFHAWAPHHFHLATPFDCHDYIQFFFFFFFIFYFYNNTFLFSSPNNTF